MDIKKLVGLAALFVASNAGATAISYTINANNDCAGFFNVDGDVCHIQIDGELISPIIAKYETVDNDNGTNGSWESFAPSVDGTEFTLGGTGGNSGTWSYVPTGNDPAIRFWVTKTGNNTNAALELFWDVDAAELLAGGACDGASYFTSPCLNAANVVSSGNWNTSTGQGLSHISFYDTAVVPVPAAVWLFGSGLLGLVGVARRKSA